MASDNVQPTCNTRLTGLSCPTDRAAESELMVVVCPHGLRFWEYRGTRVQLEAEGVIPLGTEWPEGAKDCRWQSGRCRYWLRRTRPEGLKGPAKLWTSGDWWFLRCDFDDGLDAAASIILEKRQELAQALYRYSPEGCRAFEASYRRYYTAQEDKAFQAFKATLLPPRKKPGRKPRQGSLD